MVAIEHTWNTNKWIVKYKGHKVGEYESRIEALRAAFVICELHEKGFFEGMKEEDIAKC